MEKCALKHLIWNIKHSIMGVLYIGGSVRCLVEECVHTTHHNGTFKSKQNITIKFGM